LWWAPAERKKNETKGWRRKGVDQLSKRDENGTTQEAQEKKIRRNAKKDKKGPVRKDEGGVF